MSSKIGLSYWSFLPVQNYKIFTKFTKCLLNLLNRNNFLPGGGGKAKKKKWSKGKTRDKLNNLVLFDKNTYDKLLKEVPTYKLITPSIVSERLKVRGSLAKKGLDELLEKGLIKLVVSHRAQLIYTRNAREEASEEREVEEVKVVKAPKEKKAKINKKDAAFEAAAEALAAEEA